MPRLLSLVVLAVAMGQSGYSQDKKDPPKPEESSARAALRGWQKAEAKDKAKRAEFAVQTLVKGEEARSMSKAWVVFAAAEQALAAKPADQKLKDDNQEKRDARKAVVRTWESIADDVIVEAGRLDKEDDQKALLKSVQTALTEIEALKQPAQKKDSENWGQVQARYGQHKHLTAVENVLLKKLKMEPSERKNPRDK